MHYRHTTLRHLCSTMSSLEKTYGLSVLRCNQKTWRNVKPSQDVFKFVNYNHHGVLLAVGTANRREKKKQDFCTLNFTPMNRGEKKVHDSCHR